MSRICLKRVGMTHRQNRLRDSQARWGPRIDSTGGGNGLSKVRAVLQIAGEKKVHVKAPTPLSGIGALRKQRHARFRDGVKLLLVSEEG